MNEQYLTELIQEDETWVTELEEVALQDNVPIMDRLSIQFLMQLVRIHKPKRILEIGSGIGYSALRMLQAYPETSIVTIERDQPRYDQALKYVNTIDKQAKIDIIYGDALDILVDLHNDKQYFDFIFIDAAKGSYKQFFKDSLPLLKEQGIVITDNVLFRGMVANKNLEQRRFKNLVTKLRSFNEWLVNHSDFMTTIVPVGDGIAISIKK